MMYRLRGAAASFPAASDGAPPLLRHATRFHPLVLVMPIPTSCSWPKPVLVADPPSNGGERARAGGVMLDFPILVRTSTADVRRVQSVLFVSLTDAVLSRMAEGLALGPFANPGLTTHSAGFHSRPLPAMAATVMAEAGIELSPTPGVCVRRFDLTQFDVVVSIGVHKLGLVRDQLALRWIVPDSLNPDYRVSSVSLRGLRDNFRRQIHGLAALLRAHHRL